MARVAAGYKLVTVISLTIILLLGVANITVLASDPSPLQDFCVSDPSIRVNGAGCLDPKSVNANHFSFSGLHLAGDTSNPLGSKVTPVLIPGLNTLGLSMVRIDLAQWGVVAPHTHPRASEVVTLVEGTVEVGFISSTQNKLFQKVLNKGDVFVFPNGLVHYLKNVGSSKAFAISALSSQNPGLVGLADSLFASTPSIPTDVLAKALHVDTKLVQYIQSKF